MSYIDKVSWREQNFLFALFCDINLYKRRPRSHQYRTLLFTEALFAYLPNVFQRQRSFSTDIYSTVGMRLDFRLAATG